MKCGELLPTLCLGEILWGIAAFFIITVPLVPYVVWAFALLGLCGASFGWNGALRLFALFSLVFMIYCLVMVWPSLSAIASHQKNIDWGGFVIYALGVLYHLFGSVLSGCKYWRSRRPRRKTTATPPSRDSGSYGSGLETEPSRIALNDSSDNAESEPLVKQDWQRIIGGEDKLGSFIGHLQEGDLVRTWTGAVDAAEPPQGTLTTQGSVAQVFASSFVLAETQRGLFGRKTVKEHFFTLVEVNSKPNLHVEVAR